MEDTLAIKLHGTTDAMVWAQEFVKTLQEHPETADPHDVGFMVGWFANAKAAAELHPHTSYDTLPDKIAVNRRALADVLARVNSGGFLSNDLGVRYVADADGVSSVLVAEDEALSSSPHRRGTG